MIPAPRITATADHVSFPTDALTAGQAIVAATTAAGGAA